MPTFNWLDGANRASLHVSMVAVREGGSLAGWLVVGAAVGLEPTMYLSGISYANNHSNCSGRPTPEQTAN